MKNLRQIYKWYYHNNLRIQKNKFRKLQDINSLIDKSQRGTNLLLIHGIFFFYSLLPNRWNSMINVNAVGDSSPFRSRGNQSSISCLFDQPTKSNGNNNDLWRTNSFADVSKSSLTPPVFTPQPVPTSNATKFNHHRLW